MPFNACPAVRPAVVHPAVLTSACHPGTCHPSDCPALTCLCSSTREQHVVAISLSSAVRRAAAALRHAGQVVAVQGGGVGYLTRAGKGVGTGQARVLLSEKTQCEGENEGHRHKGWAAEAAQMGRVPWPRADAKDTRKKTKRARPVARPPRRTQPAGARLASWRASRCTASQVSSCSTRPQG